MAHSSCAGPEGGKRVSTPAHAPWYRFDLRALTRYSRPCTCCPRILTPRCTATACCRKPQSRVRRGTWPGPCGGPPRVDQAAHLSCSMRWWGLGAEVVLGMFARAACPPQPKKHPGSLEYSANTAVQGARSKGQLAAAEQQPVPTNHHPERVTSRRASRLACRSLSSSLRPQHTPTADWRSRGT